MEVDIKFGVQENVVPDKMFKLKGYLGPHAFNSSHR
jgi:hypothetical protein